MEPQLMFELMRPRVPQEKAGIVGAPATVPAAMNVATVAPEVRRFRAVVTRHIRQSAVVEFDAQEGFDTYTLAEQIVPMIAETSWTSESPSGGYIADLRAIDMTDGKATHVLLEWKADADAEQERDRLVAAVNAAGDEIASAVMTTFAPKMRDLNAFFEANPNVEYAQLNDSAYRIGEAWYDEIRA
jgi:hypothetical protein